jgi:hypothetical protein
LIRMLSKMLNWHVSFALGRKIERIAVSAERVKAVTS